MGSDATVRGMPEATMETRMRSPRPSSKVAPTMMLASGSTSWQTRLAASSTSQSVMSRPPVMHRSRLRAPFSVTSSSSGLTIASSAAAMARCSPAASPMPIMARPMSPSTARTSARSRLMSPSLMMRSVMVTMPEYMTWSAITKASANVVLSVAMRNRFSLGMTSSVSAYLRSSAMPASALRSRFAPSNWNGLVTTAMLRTPRSLASRAIT